MSDNIEKFILSSRTTTDIFSDMYFYEWYCFVDQQIVDQQLIELRKKLEDVDGRSINNKLISEL